MGDQLILADYMTPLEKKQVVWLRRAQGVSFRDISAEFGIREGTARNYCADPHGLRSKARKQGYSGSCEECGAPTSGANGRAKAPRRCLKCATALQIRDRKWGREAVIEAIRSFAEINGRPPSATDWLRSAARRGAEYPPASSIYKTQTNPNAPFDSWADAVEAAGFPRPRHGGYDRSASRYKGRPPLIEKRWKMDREKGRAQRVTTYVIFEEQEEGIWHNVSRRDGFSEALAVEEFCQEQGRTNGRYFAISAARLTVRVLKPVTTVKAVAEE